MATAVEASKDPLWDKVQRVLMALDLELGADLRTRLAERAEELLQDSEFFDFCKEVFLETVPHHGFDWCGEHTGKLAELVQAVREKYNID